LTPQGAGPRTAFVYEYDKNNRYFAQVPLEIRDLAEEELQHLGAGSLRPVHRGIHFETDREGLYRIIYHTRLATRILAPLLRFRCHNPEYLYRRACTVPWPEFFPADRTFAVFSSVANSKIRHSRYAALKLKDAIVDTFRRTGGERPSVDRVSPHIRFGIHIENDMATIHLDVAGGSLHRRGYRVESVEAPMQEILAAAVIQLSGWDGSRPLVDPMCGSGTLLCEAILRHCSIPSAFLRERFGFESLPDFDAPLWERVRKTANQGIRPLTQGLVSGGDRSPIAVRAARSNLDRLPGGETVEVKRADFRDNPGLENALIVCNPPYGVRLGTPRQAAEIYRDFGDFLKRRCRGAEAFIYFGDPGLIPAVGLRPAWKKPLKNGGLDGRLVRFDLY